MSDNRSPARVLSRLRHSRNMLLLSQVSIVDLALLSDTEAARLDFPETRARKLAESLGVPDLPIASATAIFAAAERVIAASDLRHEQRQNNHSSEPNLADGPRAGAEKVGTKPNEGSDHEIDGQKNEAQELEDLRNVLEESGLSTRSIFTCIVNTAKIRSQKSRSGLMLESLLLSAVAQFEVFISRMITISLRYDPSTLAASDKKYTFDEISIHDSLVSFTDAASDSYVDSLMYEGMQSWMRFLAKATRTNTEWVSDSLEEVVMRRNVHVHAGGRASVKYIAALGKKAAAVKVGDDLPVTAAYLNDALDRMAQAAIVLTQAALAAVCASARVRNGAEAGPSLQPEMGLVDASFDLLAAGRFACVAPLASQLEPYVTTAATRERLRANSLLAKKKQDGINAVRSEIESWDVSAAEDQLVLAKHCLLDEVDEARMVYERLSNLGEITVAELATWPILETLRTSFADESGDAE